MGNQRISDLTPLPSVDLVKSTNVIPVVSGSETYKMTVTDLQDRLTVPPNSLDKYVFSLTLNQQNTDITGSAAPQSSIIVTDTSTNNSIIHTPTQFDFPNAMTLHLEDNTLWVGYNGGPDATLTGSAEFALKVVRLEDVVVDFSSSILSYNITENSPISSGSVYLNPNSFDLVTDDQYLYISGRSTTDEIQLSKINKYNFSDTTLITLSSGSLWTTAVNKTYYNGYLYFHAQGGYSQLRVLRVNAQDLSDYTELIVGPSGTSGSSTTIQIYKNQLITTTGFAGTGFTILKYSIEGELLDSKLITPTTGGKTYNFNIPNASIILGKYLYIDLSLIHI